MEDLKYPIGKFSYSASLTSTDRKSHIDAIEATPARLRKAVTNLSEAQLDSPYRPEGWTIRQLVHHVADSHINAYQRFKLALTEDHPTIKTYEEKLWSEQPDARTLPADVSLVLLESLHTRWVVNLRAMDDGKFKRTLNHPLSGSVTLDFMLALYSWHGQHHTAHVTAWRKRNGV